MGISVVNNLQKNITIVRRNNYNHLSIINVKCYFIFLQNQIKRLKEDLEKKDYSMSEVQERERRLKVKCEDFSRDLKRERDEVWQFY